MIREKDWFLASLLVVCLINGGCQTTAEGTLPGSPTPGDQPAQPFSAEPVPEAKQAGGDSGSYGSRPSNPETVEGVRQALRVAYEEPESEKIVDPHFGFGVARDQNASPFDEGLVGNWTVYQLDPKYGTRAVTTLRIDADRSYTYGAYGGTFQYGRPNHYYLDSSTYWGFQEPLGGYYLRRGTRILGQDVIRIYSSKNNRMAGFAIQEGG